MKGFLLSVKKLLNLLIYLFVVPFAVLYLFPQFFLSFQYQYSIPAVQSPVLPVIGIVVIDVGTMLVLWCLAIVFVYKQGSVHPFLEPRNFIIKGPYRIVLHPMMLAMHIILLGEILFLQSLFLVLWLFIWMWFAHLYVVHWKEPYFLAVFGQEYYEHWKHTPRWLPKFRLPWF